MTPQPLGSRTELISIVQLFAAVPARRCLFGAFSNRLKTNLQEQIRAV